MNNSLKLVLIFLTSSCLFDSQVASLYLPPNSYEMNSMVTFYWEFMDDGYVEMALTTSFNGWAAIGFGKNMKNVDMIGMEIKNGEIAIYDLYSTGNDIPDPDSSQGGTDDIIVLATELTSSSMYAYFKRKADTGDSFDDVLTEESAKNIGCAYQTSTTQFSSHGSKYNNRDVDFENLNTDETVVGTVDINNIDYPPNKVTLTSGVDLYWSFVDSSSVDIAIKTDFVGWVGIGYGPGMYDVDMVYIETSGNVLTVVDCYSTKEDKPTTDDVNDYTVVEYAIGSTSTYVRLNRLLDTGDSMDQVLAEETRTFSYAFSSSRQTIADHGKSNRGELSITFTNDAGIVSSGSGDSGDPGRNIHIWVLLINWGLLVDIAILCIRFFGHRPFGIYLHSTILFWVDVSTIFLIVIILVENSGSYSTSGANGAHLIIGIIVLVWVIIQHLSGFVTLLLLRIFKNIPFLSKTLILLNFFHKYNGFILYFVAKVEIMLGVNKAWEAYIIAIYLGIWAPIALNLLFFVNNLFRKQKTKRTKVPSQNQKHKEIVQNYNKTLSSDYIRKNYPNSQIALLNNSIYDLSNYLHPGGNFMLGHNRGREMSRFIFGVEPQRINGKEFRHKHTQSTISALNSYYIGELELAPESFSVLTSHKPGKFWTLSQVHPLSRSVSLISFACNEEKTQVINTPNGTQWLGRHFSIAFQNPGRQQTRNKRLYTTVISMTAENRHWATQLSELAKSLIDGSNAFQGEVGLPPETTKNLPLCIKKYDRAKAFSAQISDSAEGTMVKLKGPYGLGMEIGPESHGVHVAIAGGTGYFTFLDLLFYMFVSAVCKVAQKKGVSLEFAGRFVNLFQNFKLILISSFATLQDFVGHEWIRLLGELDKAHDLNMFEGFVRITSQNDGALMKEEVLGKGITTFSKRLDKESLEKMVPKNLTRVFVCGPPEMNALMVKSLPQISESLADKVFLV